MFLCRGYSACNMDELWSQCAWVSARDVRISVKVKTQISILMKSKRDNSIIKHWLRQNVYTQEVMKAPFAQKAMWTLKLVDKNKNLKVALIKVKKKKVASGNLSYMLQQDTCNYLTCLLFYDCVLRLVKLLRQKPYQRRTSLWSGPCWSRFDLAWTCPRLCYPLLSWSQDPFWTNSLITTSMQTSSQSKTSHLLWPLWNRLINRE